MSLLGRFIFQGKQESLIEAYRFILQHKKMLQFLLNFMLLNSLLHAHTSIA